ncbi:MAG: hypothetical protein NTV00_03260 [Methylococcales bacterium]|nr:hypothetical protein [Methylococcales bacterium]
MQINSAYDNPFTNVDSIGIAIGRPDFQRDQQHIGILFIDQDQLPKCLHLAWHFDLRKDTPNPKKYLWLNVPIDPINKIHLATVCELIFQSNIDRIPYGISMEGTGFSEDGTFITEHKFAGLTCATFVIQVFHSQGYKIVDVENWCERDDDKVWQSSILRCLEEGGASAEHVEFQRQQIPKGAARFRPEEVAAAASLPGQPYGLEHIIEPAKQILDAISHFISDHPRG